MSIFEANSYLGHLGLFHVNRLNYAHTSYLFIYLSIYTNNINKLYKKCKKSMHLKCACYAHTFSLLLTRS